jgi:hypothetical protein
MDKVGNYSDVKADYVLTNPQDQTELAPRLTVWPKALASAKISRADRERSTGFACRRFAAALENDYARMRTLKKG